MEVIINIIHWDDGTEARKELRIYDEKGNALGYGKEKVVDTEVIPEDTPQLDIFSDMASKHSKRMVTYIATINLDKLIKSVEL